MKRREEHIYYQWLEDVIRSRVTASSFFDNKSKEEHDVEIMLLVNYIQRKNPKLFERLLSGTVNATELSSATRNDIYKFLGKTEKGTALIWKDKDDNEFLFLNAGEGINANKKRIVILSNSFNKNNIEQFKNALFSEILRKDVDHIYRQIQEKERRKHNTNSNSFITDLFSTKKGDIIHSASSFEKSFKNIIRSQGYAASPMTTAHIMIKSMNIIDKRQLQNSFISMGVNNGEDLQNLLSRWKTEALMENQKPIKRIIHSRSEQSQSISM